MNGNFESNQLKLNLNAVVDRLNLVNVVHKPNPIVIEKNFSNGSHSRFSSSNVECSNSQYEYIDEHKLSMYSYLVQRDLKSKEWLSKYESNNFEQLIAKPNGATDSTLKSENKENLKKKDSNSVATIVKPTPRTTSQKAPKPSSSSDISICCTDLIKNLENLFNILTEFKDERLKIVFNDPVEEEKQNRIQIEQIKYLSRSIYNYQNQINTLRNQIKKDKTTNAVQQRLVHTIRQIIKLTVSFGEIYPYRQDKSVISEKLCSQFYKHLNNSIKNFVDCLTNYEQNYISQLRNLVQNCNVFFLDSEEKPKPDATEKKGSKENKQSKSKNVNQVFNVIRVSRNSQDKNHSEVEKVSSKRIFDKKKPKNQFSNVRFEISPPRSQQKQKFQNKKIKTAKLFPSNKTLSQNKSHSDLDTIPIKDTGAVKTKNEHKSIEDLNSSMNELDILTRSNDQVFKPAFRHLSSPKLGKIKPILSRSVSRSRSRSADKLNNRIHKTISNESILSDCPDHDSYSPYEPETPSPEFKRSILKTQRNFNPTRIFEKLDSIRHQNDLIRKKYQNLSYYSPEMHSCNEYDETKYRKPYQECYLDENSKPKMQDLECPVTFEKVYKPLNAPSLDQLKRVIKYSEDFKDYMRKTSITKIGDSEFDDFELFEILSNDLFGEIFESIYDEIENLNEHVAQNLLNNEFECESQDENSKKSNNSFSNEYEQSFEQTFNSSKRLTSAFTPQRKSTKTVSIQKTSSKTSSSSNNNLLSQQNDLILNNFDELSNNNIVEEIPDQINTHFSSIHSNIDESISSISD